ncbi:hypothetical protein GVX76_05465 [[Haemophilus] felis]|nr:hypothetical protein [[Haemophilus] felis]
MGTSLTNGGVEFLDAYRTGKDPIYEGISSGVIALGGAALGGKVQRGLDAKFNPISNKYKFEPLAPSVPIYKSPDYNYIPSVIGGGLDNFFINKTKSLSDAYYNQYIGDKDEN